jgi:hypothetical protein
MRFGFVAPRALHPKAYLLPTIATTEHVADREIRNRVYVLKKLGLVKETDTEFVMSRHTYDTFLRGLNAHV